VRRGGRGKRKRTRSGRPRCSDTGPGSNGEGYDISIDRKNGQEKFSLTFGEFDLLTVLMHWRGE
jgi:hypothetical protein